MEYLHPHRKCIRPVAVGGSPTHKAALFQRNSDLRRNAVLCEGFTLLELLVVLGIITVVTLVALTSQSSFNKTLILSNTAYDIALSIRSAETFGIGSRAAAASNAGYGVNFTSGNLTKYTMFADTSPAATLPSPCHPNLNGTTAPNAIPGNCFYTSDDQLIQSYTLGNGITISNMCAYTGATSYCISGGNNNTLTSLDIVFSRPNPDAFITINGVDNTLYTGACIAIVSPQGGTSRKITIGSSGTIVPSQGTCP
jgi:prepilin-type N-terminal cleavage/methylation domain-containing protein